MACGAKPWATSKKLNQMSSFCLYRFDLWLHKDDYLNRSNEGSKAVQMERSRDG